MAVFLQCAILMEFNINNTGTFINLTTFIQCAILIEFKINNKFAN